MFDGKLGVIKTIGEKPVFVILDRDNKPCASVPDLADWLLRRIGYKIDLSVSDSHFVVTVF